MPAATSTADTRYPIPKFDRSASLVIRHAGVLSFRDALSLGQRVTGALRNYPRVVVDVSACESQERAARQFLEMMRVTEADRIELRVS